MKYILLVLTVVMTSACSDSFIIHSLKSEKIGACNNEPVAIKMLSNISGERYEFVSCLDDNFDGKNYLVDRKGDSLLISFPSKGNPKAAFKITLDIDAKPAYHHIFLDGKEVGVGEQ